MHAPHKHTVQDAAQAPLTCLNACCLQLTKGIARKQAAAQRAKQKKDDNMEEGEEDEQPIVEQHFDPAGEALTCLPAKRHHVLDFGSLCKHACVGCGVMLPSSHEQTPEMTVSCHPAEAGRPPIYWIQIDANLESLADTLVLQPEYMWIAQLEQSLDVAAQSAAIAGLTRLRCALLKCHAQKLHGPCNLFRHVTS